MGLVEEGKTYSVNYNTVLSQYRTVAGQVDYPVNISPALARLNSVFVSLHKRCWEGNSAFNGWFNTFKNFFIIFVDTTIDK